MLFVIHATDIKDGMPTRAKFYRAHRTHLDHATAEGVHVLTAGPLVADDGTTAVILESLHEALAVEPLN